MEGSATSELFKRFLIWNYYEVYTQTDEGGGAAEDLKKVPASFKDEEEYIEIFSNLLLEEAAALLLRGYEDTDLPVAQRCVSGSFKETQDGFFVATLVVDPGISHLFNEKDGILLTKQRPEAENFDERLHALGVVEGRRSEQSLDVRFYLQEQPSTKDSEKQRLKAVTTGLKTKMSTFFITRLSSLSTLMREWNAVHSIRHITFKDLILTSKPMHSLDAPKAAKAPQEMEEAMAKQYNSSQMQAMKAGLGGQQTVLIQGPPGTGKTKTLLGLLSIILNAAPEGSLGLRKYPTCRQLTREEVLAHRLAQMPWLTGAPNPRDSVKPSERGDPDDCFGLDRKVIPVVLNKNAPPKAHVLVCAPSNSALDEIVFRLMENGIMDRKGKGYTPSIVRVGLQVHHTVMPVSLDTLVNDALAKSSQGAGGAPAVVNKSLREHMKLKVLNEANIVCCTLSFSGSDLLRKISKSKPFDVVVIDEAAQAVEPSTLIPLGTGARQVFLIGDPVQLPATVISSRAVAFNYDTSLFKRLQEAGFPVNMLDTQYRMHPSISAFPSEAFYGGNLKDGPGVAENTTRPWHAKKVLGPFAFFDVRGTESVPENSSSIINIQEAELIFTLYGALGNYCTGLSASDVAIISPYKAQVQLMRRKFKDMLGEEKGSHIDINTIDGFQGREKEIAIFSAVRSNTQGKIGFVADERRINVGLTRARCSMLVVGNAYALKSDPRWKHLLRHARVNRCFFKATRPFHEFFGKALSGEVKPVGPTAEDLRVLEASRAQEEDHVEEEEGVYSDGEDEVEARIAKKHTSPAPQKEPPAKKQRKKRG